MAEKEIGNTPQGIISKAKAYASSGRTEIALLILEGGVMRHSESVIILEEFVALARHVAGTLPSEKNAQQLTTLSLFVKARIPFVNTENIECVVALADEIAAEAEHANDELEVKLLLSDTEIVYLESAKNGTLSMNGIATLNGMVPITESAFSDAAHSLDKLLDYASSADIDSRSIGLIQDVLEQVRSAQQFDAALAEADRLLDSAHSSAECFAGYMLQQADQILRNLVVGTTGIASWRTQKLISAVQRLSSESEKVSANAKEREAKERFQAMEILFKQDIEKLNALPNPSSTNLDGAFQAKLTAMQNPMQRLLALSPILSGTEYAAKLSDKLQELQSKAIKWSQDQQRRYDQWAMLRIRKGYEAGSKHISKVVPDDEEKIASALIDYFAEIDVRYLSPDVQRSYSEIFEIVYGRLNAPKRDEKKDYADKGGKLYALMKMMDKPKKSLSDF